MKRLRFKCKMKKIIYITLLLIAGKLWSQTPTISPQVINSAGEQKQLGNSGIYVTDNIGEPFTEMIGSGSLFITQGYIQPEVVTIGGFTTDIRVNNLSCDDKQDGQIIVKVIKPIQAINYQVTYSWSPTSTCTANCDSIVNLSAQTYSVGIFITYTNNVGSVKTDTIRDVIKVESLNGLCLIKVFNGITANGDGNNDVLIIENIDRFPNSTLTVFNRWGQQVGNVKGYDNTTNPWPTKDKLDNLLSSTYFYVLDLGDGSKPIKGWLELIKN
jgi:gliding motility-associated-like protein